MSVDSISKDEPVEFIFVAEEKSSSEEPAPSHWSSLEVVKPILNKKKLLYEEGKYTPGSGEVCAKYLTASQSSILRHPYYDYAGVLDPGIKEALLASERPVIYPDDGQALYLYLCEQMNICPVRIFHKNLLNTEINVSYYGVNQQGVRAMAKALQYNKHVLRFNLTDNFLNDDACYHLGRMLSRNVTLSELILTGCRIGPSGMLRLGDSLRKNQSLIYLDISNNNLGDAGGKHFAQQIYDGGNVRHANLSKNQLGQEYALAFADVLIRQNRFTHLDLSWNRFYHAPSTVKMLNQLAESAHLTVLNLAYNALQGTRVAIAIKNVLLVPTLVVLDLSSNCLKNEAIDTIVPSLYEAKKLRILDLSSNPLTPQDAYNVLHTMLRPRIKVHRLLLNNVCVDKPFIEILARIKRMKSRKNFVCKFGNVLHNWTVEDRDTRELVLKRAQYLGMASTKKKVDTALYFLALGKEMTRSVPIKEMVDRLSDDLVPLDEDLIEEFSWAFPGPSTAKSRTININSVCSFIQRIWPNKKLPPARPPKHEPESESVSSQPLQ